MRRPRSWPRRRAATDARQTREFAFSQRTLRLRSGQAARMFARRAQIPSASSGQALQRQKLALQDDNRSALPSKPPVNFRKYLVLAGVTVFAAAGDSMLS